MEVRRATPAAARKPHHFDRAFAANCDDDASGFLQRDRRHPQSAQQPHLTLDYIAVIYKWCLTGCTESDPLRGIFYFGQSVRRGFTDALAIATTRWNNEISQARREHHEIGLLAAIRMYGAGAFVREVMEVRSGSLSDMENWANERERHHIAANGGPLQDMYTRAQQTLNLTPGGKGCNFAISLEIHSRHAWNRFWKQLVSYVEQHNGDACPPHRYVTPDGYRLGCAVVNVRTGSMLMGRPPEVEAQRRADLDALPGWVWNVRDVEYYRFRDEMDAFVAAHGHGRVFPDFETAGGYQLYRTLVRFRCSGNFMHGEDANVRLVYAETNWPGWRGCTLEDRYNQYDASYEKFVVEMDDFVREHGHALVSRSHVSTSGYPLGVTLSTVRNSKQFLKGQNAQDRCARFERWPFWSWGGRLDLQKKKRIVKRMGASHAQLRQFDRDDQKVDSRKRALKAAQRQVQ